MKKLLFILPAVLLLVAGCGYAATSPKNTVGGNLPAVSNIAGTNGSTANPSQQKFSDSPYYSSSSLISGDTLSAAAQNALTGFTLSKQTLADGTTQINLTAKETGYQNQSYNLKPGEQLYFTELNPGDDSSGKERNQGDDFGTVVDASGYIVSGGR